MNPLCKCGCGLEVLYPTDKYLFGHSTPKRKLTVGQCRYAREAHAMGMSQHALARELGVSQTTINFIIGLPSWGELPLPRGPVVRQHEIDRQNEMREAYQKLKDARTLIKKMSKGARSRPTK